LVVYISKELKAGKKQDEIRQILTVEKWTNEDIDLAFKQVAQSPATSERKAAIFFKNKSHIILIVLIAFLFLMGVGVVGLFNMARTVNETYSLSESLKLTGTTSPQISTIEPTAIKFNSTDCGTERFTLDMAGSVTQSKTGLDCFINASKTCTPRKLTMVYELNQSNVTFNSSVSYETARAEHGCKLSITQGKISYTLPIGIPEDLLEPLLGPIKKLENTEGFCVFAEYNELSSIFEKLRDGDFGMLNSFSGGNQVNQSETYLKGTCEGSYFTALR